jgi:hypothetical protein
MFEDSLANAVRRTGLYVRSVEIYHYNKIIYEPLSKVDGLAIFYVSRSSSSPVSSLFVLYGAGAAKRAQVLVRDECYLRLPSHRRCEGITISQPRYAGWRMDVKQHVSSRIDHRLCQTLIEDTIKRGRPSAPSDKAVLSTVNIHLDEKSWFSEYQEAGRSQLGSGVAYLYNIHSSIANAGCSLSEKNIGQGQ